MRNASTPRVPRRSTWVRKASRSARPRVRVPTSSSHNVGRRMSQTALSDSMAHRPRGRSTTSTRSLAERDAKASRRPACEGDSAEDGPARRGPALRTLRSVGPGSALIRRSGGTFPSNWLRSGHRSPSRCSIPQVTSSPPPSRSRSMSTTGRSASAMPLATAALSDDAPSPPDVPVMRTVAMDMASRWVTPATQARPPHVPVDDTPPTHPLWTFGRTPRRAGAGRRMRTAPVGGTTGAVERAQLRGGEAGPPFAATPKGSDSVSEHPMGRVGNSFREFADSLTLNSHHD